MVKGFAMPTDVIPGIREQQPYYDSGKYKLALELVSPIKGPNLEQLCIEVLSVSPLDAAKAYDQDVQKQAVLLNLPGWYLPGKGSCCLRAEPSPSAKEMKYFFPTTFPARP